MDPNKVRKIKKRQELNTVHDVRCFPGLVNCYCHFVEVYLKTLSFMNDLLKMSRPWCWMEKCKETFCELRLRMVFLDLEEGF